MNIQEAVTEAIRVNGFIAREFAWWNRDIKIKPTNTRDCCLIYPITFESEIGKLWNPAAEDLMATDWYVDTKNG